MKTKEQIQKYNKEYSARPEVKEKARIKNALLREKRKLYKKTEVGRNAENKYRRKQYQRTKKKRALERYGITEMFYNLLLEKANGKCDICGKDIPKYHIDHDHKTKYVRGILCMKCNLALGLLNDDVEVLQKAIKYLNKPVSILQKLKVCTPTQQQQKELQK